MSASFFRSVLHFAPYNAVETMQLLYIRSFVFSERRDCFHIRSSCDIVENAILTRLLIDTWGAVAARVDYAA